MNNVKVHEYWWKWISESSRSKQFMQNILDIKGSNVLTSIFCRFTENRLFFIVFFHAASIICYSRKSPDNLFCKNSKIRHGPLFSPGMGGIVISGRQEIFFHHRLNTCKFFSSTDCADNFC